MGWWGGGRPLGGPGGAWGVNLGLGIAAGVGPALEPPEPACGRPLTPTPPFWPFAMGREYTGDRGGAEGLPF
jgi:hypothetical protein